MAVHIRLQRHGSTHRPFYHIVAADHRKPRNGRYLERLGYYDPNHSPSVISLKDDRIQHWYGIGAQLSTAVDKLVKIQKVELSRKKLTK
jgi:small subunit ribosomal protein S16